MYRTLCLTALALGLSPHAMAQTLDRKVVTDSFGEAVVNSFGNCVRSEWRAAGDNCAQMPVAQAAPPPRTTLRSDEGIVYFPFDSAELTPQARQQLTQLADKLRGARDVQSAQIIGYADKLGASSYNRKLSQRRALAVTAFLAERGYLNAQVVDLSAVGESRPSVACDESMPREAMIRCLSEDRKVEIAIDYVGGGPQLSQR